MLTLAPVTFSNLHGVSLMTPSTYRHRAGHLACAFVSRCPWAAAAAAVAAGVEAAAAAGAVAAVAVVARISLSDVDVCVHMATVSVHLGGHAYCCLQPTFCP